MAIGIIIAGVIMFEIGLYYAMFKAGIPYQDPPLELQIEYAVNSGVGDILLAQGGKLFLVGLVMGIILIIVSATDKKRMP